MEDSLSTTSKRKLRWPIAGAALIVDDMPLVRTVYRRQLSRTGCVCFEAGTHDEALELLRNHAISVVILDYQMGTQDPAVFAKKVKEQFPDTLVVGHSGQNRREQFQQMSVRYFMLKPWNLTELFHCIADSQLGDRSR